MIDLPANASGSVSRAAVFIALLMTTAGAPAPPDIVFNGACDGSAAVMLGNGIIASAHDDDNFLRAFRLPGGDEVKDAQKNLYDYLGASEEADLEGSAWLGDTIYWIGSHGLSKKAKPKPDRLRLFATTWDGQTFTPSGTPRKNLLAELVKIEESTDLRKVQHLAPEKGGINIEGLAAKDGEGLLIGFRSPLTSKGEALVITLLKAAEFIETGQPTFGGWQFLELGGRGVRSIERTSSGDYVIVAGKVDDSSDFQLFRWSGRSKDVPRPISANIAGLEPEALVMLDADRALILSDDGSDACKEAESKSRKFRGRVISIPK